VVSPTFTLVHEHVGTLPLFHADLYRLEDPRQIAELGLDDYAARGGVLAVEWAERAGDALPPGAVTVRIEVTGRGTRRITVTPPAR
jgi:tRNA threonylcarbamoyl adenosine modification protein YjeE